MKCSPKLVGKKEDGRWLWVCSVCGREQRTDSRERHPPKASCKPALFGPLSAKVLPRSVPQNGPGKELTKLILSLQLHRTKNCGCAELAAQMNVWGAALCRTTYRQLILDRLGQNYDTLTWLEKIRAGLLGATWINPLDPLGSTLEEACRRAEEVRPVYVNLQRIGWGDMAIFAWIAEGTKDSTRPLILCAEEGPRAEHIRLLGQIPELDVTKDKTEWNAFTAECEEGMKTPRLEFYARFYNVPNTPKRPTLHIPPAYTTWAKSLGADRKTVMFFPNSLAKNRVWPTPYWTLLANLLQAQGLRCLSFPIRDFERYPNPLDVSPIAKVAALMQFCGLGIGGDSALINWTALMDLPALALLGPTKAPLFAHAPLIRCLTADPAIMPCTGCCYDLRHSPWCSEQCLSLANITPAAVAQAATSYLAEAWQ